jgi:nucleotide-binding universal stress UspA family protein
MYRRILVPTDGSPVSERAVDAAIDFARSCGCDVVALSVAVPEPAFQSLEGAAAYDPGLQADLLLEGAKTQVESVAARAGKAGVPCSTLTTWALDPAEAIVDAARAQGCDLIVMGSHGRRGLSRLIAGSVTQAVLAYAPVPVMVLRPAVDNEREQAQSLARPCPAAGQAPGAG